MIGTDGEAPRPSRRRLRHLLAPILLRGVLFVALWLVLAGPDPHTWWLAAAVILTTVYVSLRTVPVGSVRLRPAGLLRFIPFFLIYSLRGGVDVARRAIFQPDVSAAEYRTFEVRLAEGPPRTFFAMILGLLPGTLTARISGARIEIHTLDASATPDEALRRVERRVADVFGGSME
ncbi:MAG: Na+/H+ antiporter subunit E [Gemmatimonadota bacterium]